MSATVAATRKTTGTRVIAWILAILGVFMVIIGGAVWAVTANKLSDQKISVAAVTKDNPGDFAGSPVDSPWTALAQINAIQEHTKEATDNRTYAEIPQVATSDGETSSESGALLTDQEKADYQARNTAQTSSFLQASLFESVMAFGVAVLIMGLGVLFVLVALGFFFLIRQPQPATAPDITESRVSAAE